MAAPTAPAEAPPTAAQPSEAKLWLLSLRAPFLVASVIPAITGILLAFDQLGTFDALLAVLTIVGIICFQLATNMLNDHFDFRSGNDLAVDHHNPFAGGGRVLITGRIPLRAHLAVATAFLLAGTAIGLVLVAALGGLATSEGRTLLLIGILGWGATVFYVGPPIKLAHRGLGEIAVGMSFGPLVLVGAYVVQARSVSMGAVLLSIAMGCLVTAILWINEFPDVKADLSVGKRTAMARFGPARALRVYEGLVGAAFVFPAVAVAVGAVSPLALLCLLTAPLAAKAVKAARANYADPHALVPANAGTIMLTTFFGILLIAGIAAGVLTGL